MTNALFDRLLAPHGSRPDALRVTPDGRHLIYSEMMGLSARMAHMLVDEGVSPGDRVAAQVDKSPEALALYFACVQTGAVLLPLNAAYTTAEVTYFVADAEPGLVVCEPAMLTALEPVAVRYGAAILPLKGAANSFAQLAATKPKTFHTVARTSSDLAAILYTSGTTGRSKGAMLTQDNLLSNALALAEAWRFTGDDVLLHALPIFHTHGLFVATNIILAVGGSMLFLPRFDVQEVIRLLPRATSMMGVPTFYTRLLAEPEFTEALTRHMRLFVSGSAPLLADTHMAFEERTGHRILERYGMTETNMNTTNPYDGPRKAGTVGKPLAAVDVVITDPETGARLAAGEVGMIEVRGPNVFRGYWRMPEKTNEELRSNGFFITGDLGLIDEDGYLVIVGRAKDLIITGGFNVYPKEVEMVVDEMVGVVETAVFGVPHPDFGEAVVAAVVIDDGSGLDEQRIIESASDRLARFKQPKRVVLVGALPRNTMGKVQKSTLRETYADLFG
ncbi:MAG: malonyl-CoA synthase [Geminicoccaceae bacterium]